MLCRNPYVTNTGMAYGCGQCMPCRYNKRRQWTHRIILESKLHSLNGFATLTYSDDHIPEGGTLVTKHLTDFFKRLRRKHEFRYFACGEYGDTTIRPHYHVAFFGFGCVHGRTRIRGESMDCCWYCHTLQDTWGKGHALVGSITPQSASYIAGYVTKKMTRKDDERLQGRHPEFARMSLKPGIGKDALPEIASQLMWYGLDEKLADVPNALRHGGTVLPLGRYLTRNLRLQVGKDAGAPQAAIDKISEALLPLRVAARNDPKNPSLKEQIVKAGAVRNLQIDTRQKLYRKARTL